MTVIRDTSSRGGLSGGRKVRSGKHGIFQKGPCLAYIIKIYKVVNIRSLISTSKYTCVKYPPPFGKFTASFPPMKPFVCCN